TTIWLLDQVPALDAATWRLEISGQVGRPGSMSYQELLARPAREVQAVIDCTGGWWSEQVWRGVSIGDLLEARGLRLGATEATVISVTGHRWTFPLDELRPALLGTHVGGELLRPAHVYPVPPVSPGPRA